MPDNVQSTGTERVKVRKRHGNDNVAGRVTVSVCDIFTRLSVVAFLSACVCL